MEWAHSMTSSQTFWVACTVDKARANMRSQTGCAMSFKYPITLNSIKRLIYLSENSSKRKELCVHCVIQRRHCYTFIKKSKLDLSEHTLQPLQQKADCVQTVPRQQQSSTNSISWTRSTRLRLNEIQARTAIKRTHDTVVLFCIKELPNRFVCVFEIWSDLTSMLSWSHPVYYVVDHAVFELMATQTLTIGLLMFSLAHILNSAVLAPWHRSGISCKLSSLS